MHLRSLIFVTQQNFTAHSVSQVTSRDNIETHHRPSKQWFTQLLLTALISLPLPGNASDRLKAKEPAQAAPKVAFNIPRQAADDALPVFGQQANVTVIYPFNRIKDHQTNALQGVYSVPHAVAVLLADTGLEGDFSAEGHLVITQVDLSKGKRMNITTKKSLLATMIALFAAGTTVQTAAQSDSNNQATAQRALDEIIVTAEKREQNLQDVPAAISALDSEALKIRGIQTVQDLQFSVPGLTIGETTFGSAQVTIRGVGTENINAGGDPGVPLHIDGHYIQFPGYMLQDFLDVARVEVQRGPQGTLYGRNAVGGNINIITNGPSDHFEGELSVDVGNYNKRQITGVISGPLTDHLSGRFAFADEKRDGFVENISPLAQNEELLGSNYTSIRASLQYALTDNIEILLSGYHYADESITWVQRLVSEYPNSGFYTGLSLPANISAIDPQKIRADFDYEGSEDAEGVSLDINLDFNKISFKSLTAYNDAERAVGQDLDGSDIGIFDQRSVLGSKTITQEFQLLSNDDKDLKWIAGLFYFEEKSDLFLQITLPILPGSEFTNNPVEVETQSTAMFGQVDYFLTKKLELTAGLRHSRDEKDMLWGLFFTLDGVNPIIDDISAQSDSWSKTTGKLGLNYYASDDILFYGLYSLGFKAGGFNGTGSTETSYDPETLDAYEVGMKGQFLDNQLQLNISGYYYDYTDKTESKIDFQPGATVESVIFTNAGAATISGIDIELQSNISRTIAVDLSFAYQNTEYDEYSSQDPTRPSLGVLDLSGNQLTRSPKLKLHLGLQYNHLLGNNLGEIIARLDYSWVDKQYYRPFNLETDKQDSYHRTNATVQWGSINSRWNAELYVRNIEDADVQSNLLVASAALGFGHYGSYLDPRTYGIKVQYSF